MSPPPFGSQLGTGKHAFFLCKLRTGYKETREACGLRGYGFWWFCFVLFFKFAEDLCSGHCQITGYKLFYFGFQGRVLVELKQALVLFSGFGI